MSGAKEKRARDKGLFRRQSGRGQLWGDSEWPWCLLCHTVSQHLHGKKGYCLFWRLWIPCGYCDISDAWPEKTSQKHPEAHRCRATGFRGEGSCPRVTPSLHAQEGSPGPTSLTLSLTALHFMFCSQYPVLYYPHHQWYQLPSPSSSLHPQGEERSLRVGPKIGTWNNTWPVARRRAPSAGQLSLLQMLLSPVAEPEPPTTWTTWE